MPIHLFNVLSSIDNMPPEFLNHLMVCLVAICHKFEYILLMKFIFCFFILCCPVLEAKEHKFFHQSETKLQGQSDFEKSISMVSQESKNASGGTDPFYVCSIPSGIRYKISDLDGFRKCSELNGDPSEGKSTDINLPSIGSIL